MVAAILVVGCFRSQSNCDLTRIEVAPVHATTPAELVVSPVLRTKKGGKPVPGRTLELSLEEHQGAGGIPVEADTGPDGSALFNLAAEAKDHGFIRNAIRGAHVMHVKYRNPDEGEKTRGFCASDAWVEFSYTGPSL